MKKNAPEFVASDLFLKKNIYNKKRKPAYLNKQAFSLKSTIYL